MPKSPRTPDSLSGRAQRLHSPYQSTSPRRSPRTLGASSTPQALMGLGLSPRTNQILGVPQSSQTLQSALGISGLTPASSSAVDVYSSPKERARTPAEIWQAAQARVRNTTVLPSYRPGEEIVDDDDGARYTLSSSLKMRKIELRALTPVRSGTSLEPGKTTNVLLSLGDHGKLMPLKVNRFNQVVDGNHRFDVARRLGLTHCWVVLDQNWPTPAVRQGE